MRRGWEIAISFVIACSTPPREGPRAATAYDAAVAGAFAASELAHQAPEQAAFAWRLEVQGERATYYACTAEDACTYRRVEIPAAKLLGTTTVGRARPLRVDGTTGDEVDVLRIAFVHDTTTTRGGINSDARGIIVR